MGEKSQRNILFKFAVLCFYTGCARGFFIQRGKVSLSTNYPSGHACDSIVYPNPFTGQASVQVQATVEGASSSPRHGGVAVWISSVTSRSFRVCILRTGRHVNNTVEVNWFATGSSPVGVLRGSVPFTTWTTGTKCEYITFNTNMVEKPALLVTARHQATDRVEDAASVWVEDVTLRSFKVCMREMRNFEGPHKNIVAEWIVFMNYKPSWNITQDGRITFNNTNQPKALDNYAYCKKINFTKAHYSPPVIVATVTHMFNANDPNSVSPKSNALNVWMENITNVDAKICVKDLVELGGTRDSYEVNFVTVGDLDPCISETCDYHAVCKAFGPNDARCVCITNCPNLIETVCASNGETFDNKCLMELAICNNKSDFSLYHPGNCLGFQHQRGFYEMRRSSKSSDHQCSVIRFKPYTFYPDKRVHVQVSVSHTKHTSSNQVHDATASWVENVNENNFTVCVLMTGRNGKLLDSLADIDWFAYQDSPPKSVIGSIQIQNWWTGTTCKTVSVLKNSFSSAPTVLATVEHIHSDVKRDAASVWVEDITASNFRICLRELQNFDGSHEDVYVNWMAFVETPWPFIREHNSVTVTLTHPPLNEHNAAECQNVAFTQNYTGTPTVLVTAAHSSSGGNKVDPVYNGISVWNENVNKTGFQTCAKELYVKKYDPIDVQYAVLADICPDDWHYFRGFCYYTHPDCTGWNNASVSCHAMGSDLVSVQDQEENVYIQHLHGGEKSWIGLTDLKTEGTFVWSDNSKSSFTFWAHGQPNNYKEEDCVHVLGIKYRYQWNDVPCTDCHPYTCKKDYDECAAQNLCENGGRCANSIGSYSCICSSGFTGKACEADINECSTSPCQNGGTCHNTHGSFSCTCTAGYGGATCAQVPSSCKAIKQFNSNANSGIFSVLNGGTTHQVFCDMSNNGGGWTLIARFSNSDSKYWMQKSGNWWYDKYTVYGSTTSTSSNSDMISKAFWTVTGSEMKFTRSDDLSNTALLRTYSNCIGGRTFRLFITRYGNFRNGAVWASNQCRGSCPVYYGGQYTSTSGFDYYSCSSNLQSKNRIGFWCDWSGGDGAVMMVGGGGDGCGRADHGIGITEVNEASFMGTASHQDFGRDAGATPVSSYSLNLWIR